MGGHTDVWGMHRYGGTYRYTRDVQVHYAVHMFWGIYKFWGNIDVQGNIEIYGGNVQMCGRHTDVQGAQMHKGTYKYIRAHKHMGTCTDVQGCRDVWGHIEVLET